MKTFADVSCRFKTTWLPHEKPARKVLHLQLIHLNCASCNSGIWTSFRARAKRSRFVFALKQHQSSICRKGKALKLRALTEFVFAFCSSRDRGETSFKSLLRTSKRPYRKLWVDPVSSAGPSASQEAIYFRIRKIELLPYLISCSTITSRWGRSHARDWPCACASASVKFFVVCRAWPINSPGS